MAAWLKLEVSSKQWPCHGGVSDTVTPLGGGVFFGRQVGVRLGLVWGWRQEEAWCPVCHLPLRGSCLLVPNHHLTSSVGRVPPVLTPQTEFQSHQVLSSVAAVG